MSSSAAARRAPGRAYEIGVEHSEGLFTKRDFGTWACFDKDGNPIAGQPAMSKIPALDQFLVNSLHEVQFMAQLKHREPPVVSHELIAGWAKVSREYVAKRIELLSKAGGPLTGKRTKHGYRYSVDLAALRALPDRQPRERGDGTSEVSITRKAAGPIKNRAKCPDGLNCRIKTFKEAEDGTIVDDRVRARTPEDLVRIKALTGSGDSNSSSHHGNSLQLVSGAGDSNSSSHHEKDLPGEGMAKLREYLTGKFVKAQGKGPTSKEASEIHSALKGSCLEQFDQVLATAMQRPNWRMYSYGYLVGFAEECAKSREAWEKAHQNGRRHVATAAPTRQDYLESLVSHFSLAKDPEWEGHIQRGAAQAELDRAREENPKLYTEAEKLWSARK